MEKTYVSYLLLCPGIHDLPFLCIAPYHRSVDPWKLYSPSSFASWLQTWFSQCEILAEVWRKTGSQTFVSGCIWAIPVSMAESPYSSIPTEGPSFWPPKTLSLFLSSSLSNTSSFLFTPVTQLPHYLLLDHEALPKWRWQSDHSLGCRNVMSSGRQVLDIIGNMLENTVGNLGRMRSRRPLSWRMEEHGFYSTYPERHWRFWAQQVG